MVGKTVRFSCIRLGGSRTTSETEGTSNIGHSCDEDTQAIKPAASTQRTIYSHNHLFLLVPHISYT